MSCNFLIVTQFRHLRLTKCNEFGYRLKGEPVYSRVDELTEDFVYVRALMPNQAYEFIVGSVDGELFTESDPREIETYVSG